MSLFGWNVSTGIFSSIINLLIYNLFLNLIMKILLHICCAPCSTHSIEMLKQENDLVLFFYNPCIFPKEEFEKRLENAKIIAKEHNLKLIVPEYNHKKFLDYVKGYEKEPENGKRCLLCYEQRLRKTAE